MFGKAENGRDVFVPTDPASTTPEMFLSFGNKQGRKEQGYRRAVARMSYTPLGVENT
jgi:hypothetical protein